MDTGWKQFRRSGWVGGSSKCVRTQHTLLLHYCYEHRSHHHHPLGSSSAAWRPSFFFRRVITAGAASYIFESLQFLGDCLEMCNQDHSIESVSVADNEKFTYPVILIKGSLGIRCETGELKVQIDNYDCPVSKDVRFINEKRGQFKVLLRLKEGENRVTLTYCSRELELNLFFEESENPHRITPLYIICDGHDGCFQSDTAENSIENACAKITLGIQLVQSLYAEKMAEKWSSRKTFTIAGDCLPFRSSLPLQESKAMTDQQLWNFFAKEILQSELYTSEKQKFIGFISSTYYEGISDNDFSYENIKRRTTGNVALGGGGLALFGTGCLYTWPDRLDGIVPAFLNTTLVNRELMMDDSNYRYT